MPGFVFSLPSSCSAISAFVSPDVDELILAALCAPNTKQIVAFQLCACVVGVQETIIREVASGSQVGWCTSNWPHAGQRQSIGIPVEHSVAFINWMVSTKSVTFEHVVVCEGERLYQRPNKARFGVKIAVDWKAVILRIVKEVHSRCFDAICCQIFAAPRMFYFFTPLTSVLIWTGAVEPDSGGITNLLTGPPLETRVGLTAAVATIVSSLNKVSSLWFQSKRLWLICAWRHSKEILLRL